jgi:thymidylate synthase
MNTLDKQYQSLLQDILDNGVLKQDRTGTGTISLFGKQIRHKMSEGFPLLTTKKMPFRLIATELIWFLRGDTNIKYLVDNNCHIWDGDAYKNFYKKSLEIKLAYELGDLLGSQPHIEAMFSNSNELIILSKEEFIEKIKTDDEFAKKWGDLGPIYGRQWRSWKTYRKLPKDDYTTDYRENEPIDQIANLISELKTNPDSRRLMVNAWNVGELDQMVLPPCHYGFQVYTRELNFYELKNQLVNSSGGWFSKTALTVQDLQNECIERNLPTRAISLMWNQRSADLFLGIPFNIASYGLLLEIIAKAVNMVPDELIGNLGDTHLYLDHIEQAKEQIGRELSLAERRELVTIEMFNQIYNGGGSDSLSHSEINQWNVPTRTREPYPLPTLNINTEFWPTESGECGVGPIDAAAVFNGFNNEHFCKCLLEEDLQLSNYQAHPHIKAPLSN